MAALTTIWFGCANACRRAARFGVSPTTAVSDAVPSPIWSPTITGPVAMPIRTASSTPGGLRDRGIQLRHRVDDIETRPHRTLGLVLMGARVAEINEDAVAHVLRDKAVVMPDRGTAPALIRRDDIAQIFGVHPGGECRRSHQVAEHHGQLAALGLRRRGARDRGSAGAGTRVVRRYGADKTGGRAIGAATGATAAGGASPVSKRAVPTKASPCPPSSTARRLTISS